MYSVLKLSKVIFKYLLINLQILTNFDRTFKTSQFIVTSRLSINIKSSCFDKDACFSYNEKRWFANGFCSTFGSKLQHLRYPQMPFRIQLDAGRDTTQKKFQFRQVSTRLSHNDQSGKTNLFLINLEKYITNN